MKNQDFESDILRSNQQYQKLLQDNGDSKQLVNSVLMEKGILDND